jgi:FlaA1/EpsC-like NDP-sugar epimerase
LKSLEARLQSVILLIPLIFLLGIAGGLVVLTALAIIAKFYPSWRKTALKTKISIKILVDAVTLGILLGVLTRFSTPSIAVYCVAFICTGWFLGLYRSSSLDLTVSTVSLTFTAGVLASLSLLSLEQFVFKNENSMTLLELVTSTELALKNALLILIPLTLLPLRALVASQANRPAQEPSDQKNTATLLFYSSDQSSTPEVKAYRSLVESEGHQVSLIIDVAGGPERYIDGTKVTQFKRVSKYLSLSQYSAYYIMPTDRETAFAVMTFRKLMVAENLSEITLKDVALNQTTDLTPSLLLQKFEEFLQSGKPDFRQAGTSRISLDASIVITGGAGSIGSKITEALLEQGYRNVHVIDASELGLYKLAEKLSAAITDKNLFLHLGDVKDKTMTEEVVLRVKPSVIFHVAAYKHVDIAEKNADIVYKTNVIGTANLLEAANLAGVEHFTFVSTDKAVFPTNFMGATKRLAELLIENFANKTSNIQFSIVRFGNVMGSSGSALPKFSEQIIQGRYVTLTHPDMERYFMSIEEAAFLVVGTTTSADISLSGNFRCYLLDMGKPKKIIDVISELAKLAGKKLVENAIYKDDVEILITGLRPGEKLYEELSHSGKTIQTEISSIYRIDNGVSSNFDIEEELANVFPANKNVLRQFLNDFSKLMQ